MVSAWQGAGLSLASGKTLRSNKDFTRLREREEDSKRRRQDSRLTSIVTKDRSSEMLTLSFTLSHSLSLSWECDHVHMINEAHHFSSSSKRNSAGTVALQPSFFLFPSLLKALSQSVWKYDSGESDNLKDNSFAVNHLDTLHSEKSNTDQIRRGHCSENLKLNLNN